MTPLAQLLARLVQSHRSDVAESMDALAEGVRAGDLGGHPDTIQLRPDGWSTLLRYAINRGAAELAFALLDAGADPELDALPTFRSESSGMQTRFERRERVSTLSKACQCCPDVVPRLLAMGLDPNVGGDGKPPLHCAVRRGRADVVRLLLSAGADPLALDDIGCTAVAFGDDTVPDAECVQLVREAAWPRLVSRKGSSVRAQRKRRGSEGIRGWLELAVGGDGGCVAVFRRGPAADLAHALAATLGTDAIGVAHQEWVMETGRAYYGVVGLKGQEWSVALLEVGRRVDPSIGLDAAKDLAGAADTVHLAGASVHAYFGAGGDGTPVHFDDVETGLRWFAEVGIEMPLMGFSADGFCVGVDVFGVKQSDIVDGWIVWADQPLR